MSQPSVGERFEELVEIMARLRSRDGCPWDREQTHQSLVKYLIEESYEVAEAVEAGDSDALAEELGDVLLQVVFHARMGQEAGRFHVGDVLGHIIDKMVRRHPHVFGDADADTADAVLRQWETTKRLEKPERESILEGIPRTLPALQRAHRLQDRAANAGFDWDRIEEVYDKAEEELHEFRQAHESGDAEHAREEFGDFLFAIVNVARFLNLDPEECLRSANNKFTERFRYVEQNLEKNGVELAEASLGEMDALWDEAKGKGIR